MSSLRNLAAPKSNRVLFDPPRIARRWSDGRDYKQPANDNRALMDEIELSSGGSFIRMRPIDRLDEKSPEWTAGKNISLIGASVPLLDDGPRGSPPVGANDNDHCANVKWPLGKALMADGEHRLLRAATAYRRISELVTQTDVLRGTEPGSDIYRLDQRTWVNASGELVYKGARRLAGGDPAPLPAQQGSGPKRKAVKPAWAGDAGLIARLDAIPVLREIEVRVAPLLQPLENAVLDGWTLESIGRLEASHKDKQRASAVGKALVYRALGVIASFLEEPRTNDALNSLGMVGLN